MKLANRARTTSSKVIFAIVAAVALSLVFLQMPVFNYAQQARADAAAEVSAQAEETGLISVKLSFDHAYITYDGQQIAPPYSTLTLPLGDDLEFTAEADSGYEVESVVATINGKKTTLKPDKAGEYKISSEALKDDKTSISIKAMSIPPAPEPEATGVEDAAAPEQPAKAQSTMALEQEKPEGASDEPAAEVEGEDEAKNEAEDETGAKAGAKSEAKAGAKAGIEVQSDDGESTQGEGGAEDNGEPASENPDEPASLTAATTLTETPISENNAVVKIAIYASEDERVAGEGHELPDDYQIGVSEMLYGVVSFKFIPGYGPKAGRLIYTYKLPDTIITSNKQLATLYDQGNNVAGLWDIQDNIVHFYYDEDWADAHPNGGGSFYFDFMLDEEQANIGAENKFDFPGVSNTITINVRGHEISGTKENGSINNGEVTYTVKLDVEDDFGTFVFNDEIEKNLKYIPNSFYIKQGDDEAVQLPVTIVDKADGKQEATAEPRAIAKGKYTITYKARINQAAYDALKEGAKLETDTKNTAKWTYHNDNEEPKIGTAFSTVSISKDIISKSAPSLKDGDHLQWKIKINPSDKMKTDVSNFTVTDTLKAGMKYAGSFQVLNDSNEQIDSGTIPEGASSFTYTFPSDAGANRYYIKYETIILDLTKVQDLTNYAEITPGGKTTKTYHYDPKNSQGEGEIPEPGVSKVSVDESHVASNGRVSWHSKILGGAYPEPEQDSGLVLQYFDSVEQYNQATGKPRPQKERTNLEFVSSGGSTHSYYKIWIASEPTLSAGGTPLVKGVDYQFDGSITDGVKNLYGFSAWNVNYEGERVPVAFRIRFILDSDTMKTVVENNTDIDIFYETECDGTIQRYENEGRVRIVKGSVEKYGKSVRPTYDLTGASTVQKTGSMRWDPDLRKYVASWEITANRGSGNGYAAELNSPILRFRDSLPNGMEIIDGSIEVKAVQPGENGASPQEYDVPFTLTRDEANNNVAIVTADLSHSSASGGQPPFYVDGKYRAWVRLRFKTALAPSAIVHNGEEQTITNSATVLSDTVPLGTGRTKVYYTDSILKKAGDTDNEDPVVHYTIVVNELGQKLGAEDGQTQINLTDLLDYRTTVVLTSIKVFDLNTGEEITGECPVKHSNTEVDAQNHNTTSFTVSVPDERALKITYDVSLSGNAGTSYQVTNKASLEGITTKDSTFTRQYKVKHADASVYGSNTVIFITKMDSRNVVDTNLRLGGAVFALYRVNDITKLPPNPYSEESAEALDSISERVNTVTTEEDGSAVLYEEERGALQYDTLYYFKEIQAPKHYLIDDKSPHFVMLKGSDYETPYNLAKQHGVDPSEKTTYNVTDSPETVESKVVKVWEDSDNEDKARPETLTVDLMNGDEVVKTVTLSAANNWTATVSDLPKYDHDTEITYTWSEKNLKEGYTLTSNKTEGTVTTLTNRYQDTGHAVFSAKKTFTGPSANLTPNMFHFKLESTDKNFKTQVIGNEIPTATFDTITYTTDDIGDHTYTISEVLPTDENGNEIIDLDGVHYDTQKYTVTVHVAAADPGDRRLKVTYNEGVAEFGPVEFTNTYSTYGETDVEVKKHVGGQTPDKKFSFGLYRISQDEQQQTIEELVSTVENDGESVAFPTLKYYEPTTAYYVIREIAPDNADEVGSVKVADGIAYDRDAIYVEVVARDRTPRTGSMEVTKKYTDAAGNTLTDPTFDNTPVAATTYNIEAGKTITGRSFLDSDEFKFELSAAKGTPMPQGSVEDQTKSTKTITLTKNNALEIEGHPEAWGFNFGDIEYKAADLNKTYEYRITETAAKQGVTIDATSHVVKVKVTGVETDGVVSLKATGLYDDKTTMLIINNTYTASGKATFEAHKTLEGRPLDERGQEFFFTATLYKVDNVDPDVQRDQLAQGMLELHRAADSSGKVEFEVDGFTQYHVGKVFTYHITEDQGSLGGVEYDGSEYYVDVKALDDQGNGKLNFSYDKYKVVDGQKAAWPDPLEFVNKYTAEKVPERIVVTKNFTGREWKDADKFTFVLSAAKGTPMPEGSVDGEENTTKTITMTKENAVLVEGESDVWTLDFGEIEYERAETYTYTVTEKIPADAVEQNDGTFVKDGITYDNTSCTVTVEVKDEDYSGQLTATVKYGGNATAANFVNTYQAKSVKKAIQVTKTLVGRDWGDAESFEFKITPVDGAPMPNPDKVAVSRTSPNYTAAFKEVEYTTVGEYKYQIKEVVPEGVDASNPIKNGIAYDLRAHAVSVVVTDEGETGQLAAAVVYDEDDTAEASVFTNIYSTAAAALEAHKAMEGVDTTLKAGKFSFTAVGASENTNGVELVAEIDDEGKAVFETITYDAPGEYVYTITENVPEGAAEQSDGTFVKDGIVYDNTAHTATVTIESKDNKLVCASVVYDESADAPVFTNKSLAQASFEFDKYHFGGTGTFEFQLIATDEEGNPRATNGKGYGEEDTIVDYGTNAFTVTVQNGKYVDGVSKIPFPNISYTSAGVYHYLIKEVPSTQPHVNSDPVSYLAHVTVGEDGSVTTQYFTSLNGQKEETTTLMFNNNSKIVPYFNSLSAQSYLDAERVSVYPEAQKYLNGDTAMLVGGDFQFELVDEATGTVIASATNDENGKVAFFDEQKDPGLAYDEPGVYRYIIREVPGDEAGVTYDSSLITLTVSVERGEQGLEASAVYNGPGGAQPAFHNTLEGMDVMVRKVSRSGGEGLAGSTYALWMVGENGDVLVQEAVSDAQGYITFRNVSLVRGARYYFKEVAAPSGHTVDPYRTAYFALNDAGDGLVLAEETASDGWHSATENIEIDKAASEAN